MEHFPGSSIATKRYRKKESPMVPTNLESKEQRSIRSGSVSRFVDSNEFCRLLLGFKKLVRADNPAQGLRGLFDEESNILYLIEQDQLGSLQSNEHLSDNVAK